MLRAWALPALAIVLPDLAGALPAAASAGAVDGWASLPSGVPLVVEQTADRGFAAISKLAFSHSGGRIASSHVNHDFAWREPRTRRGDGGITVWQADTLEPLRELAGHRYGEGALAFTPDGQLVSGGSDQAIRVWDPTTGRELRRLGDEKRFVYSLAVSRSGRYLLAGGSDDLGNWLTRSLRFFWDLLARPPKPGYLQLWELESGELVRGYAGNEDNVLDVAFTPDGRRVIAAAFFEDRVRAWELASGTRIAELELDGARALSVLPDSRRVVAAGRKTTVLLDLESRVVVEEWPAGAHHVGILDSGRLAVAALPKRLVLRDLERRATLADLVFPSGEDRTMALAVAPDGESFVIGTRAGRLVRLRLASARAAESGLGRSPEG